jgi:hypothetical protein
MNFGIASLLGGRYKDTVIKHHPSGFGISIFTKVSGGGDGLQVVKELLATGKNIPFAELNFCWNDIHSYGSKDYKHIKTEAIRSKPLIQKYPNVIFYIVPITEDKLSEQEWRKFEAIVKKEIGHLPNVKLVHSPIKTGKFKGVINVYHHEKGGDAFNYDGASAYDADVQGDKDSYKDAEYFCFWIPPCNGNRKIFKPGDRRDRLDFIKREDRVFWPVPEDYKAMTALAKSKGSTKSNIKGLIPKSVSDRHTPKPSGKECKPVYITPLNVKPDRLELRLRGKVLSVSDSKLPYNEKKPDGTNGKQTGWRYYFSKQWGFQIANEPCELWGGGKLLAVLNPTFRDFIFR